MIQKYLECGQIMRAHGTRGAMVIKHLCDSTDVFCSLKNLYFKHNEKYEKRKILHSSPYKSGVLVFIEGVSSPEEVVKMRLTYVYADRDDLRCEDGEFFIADLIGLDVFDENTKEKYGVLSDVINRGAQDLYVISRNGRPDSYVPAIKEFISRISLEEGIYITPIEGMLE